MVVVQAGLAPLLNIVCRMSLFVKRILFHAAEFSVAYVEISKGGFSHRRAKRAGVATPTFGHVNAFI